MYQFLLQGQTQVLQLTFLSHYLAISGSNTSTTIDISQSLSGFVKLLRVFYDDAQFFVVIESIETFVQM